MPCKKCEEGKYKWGEKGECKYDTQEACESANSKYSNMKPTPLGKKTYEEYEKELKEFNLSSEVNKVELGLVQDLEKFTNQLNSLSSQIKTIEKGTRKDVATLEKLQKQKDEAWSVARQLGADGDTIRKKGNQLADQIEKVNKELGITTKIPQLQNFDNAKTSYNEDKNDLFRLF